MGTTKKVKELFNDTIDKKNKLNRQRDIEAFKIIMGEDLEIETEEINSSNNGLIVTHLEYRGVDILSESYKNKTWLELVHSIKEIKNKIDKEKGNMILITLKGNKMTIEGHANYAPQGQDIVCSAVSSLVGNYIEVFGDGYYKQSESLTTLYYKKEDMQSVHVFDFILQSLRNISETYPKYVSVEIE